MCLRFYKPNYFMRAFAEVFFCFSRIVCGVISVFPACFLVADELPQQVESVSIADLRLQGILSKQEGLYRRLESSQQSQNLSADYQEIEAVDTEYRSFILDNPDYIYGYILYGKFLRSLGEYEKANEVFVKANDINGGYAVIKQQIAAYLAEEGSFELALMYLNSAIELEPEVALYHFQMGQLLHTYRDQFIESGGLSSALIGQQQFTAFANAARLAPHNRTFQMRHAEAFFDLEDPDWTLALQQWKALEHSCRDDMEWQLIQLQKCRVYVSLELYAEAERAVSRVDHHSLAFSAEKLRALIFPDPVELP